MIVSDPTKEVPMPWMPEVFSAPIAEAIRHRDAESANDAVSYYEGIMANQPEALVRSFAGEPRVNDPRVGHVEGAMELRAFVSGTADWLRERDAVVENVALTRTSTRTVEEVVLHLLSDSGVRVELPVAIVSDRNPDRTIKTIRVYHSMWPLTGSHRVREPLLPPDPNIVVSDVVVGEYQRALAAGDLEAVLATYEADAYAREPSGGEYVYRGKEKLREVYSAQFANGGGIPLEHCTLTDDGVRCAIEYNCVRWGVTELPPQAGVAVYERGSSGRLAGGRIYDDVEPPAVSDTSAG
jgi:SnoaL-like domain